MIFYIISLIMSSIGDTKHRNCAHSLNGHINSETAPIFLPSSSLPLLFLLYLSFFLFLLSLSFFLLFHLLCCLLLFPSPFLSSFSPFCLSSRVVSSLSFFLFSYPHLLSPLNSFLLFLLHLVVLFNLPLFLFVPLSLLSYLPSILFPSFTAPA